MAINQFADLTNEEFIQTYLNTKVNPNVRRHTVTPISHPIVGDIDWDSDGKVTPVKDQGQCGSCWAFSATAAIESAVLIAGKSQVLLSEQQLVDCSQAYGNAGCNGGWMDSAFQYIIASGIQ
jgi:C1A family cysteine protease